jgi:predicted Rossmann fold nucleotide-binding protein DprA/Smf involved in DNA uptake
MRNAVEQAAYEAGRAQAKYEMLIEATAITHSTAIAGNLIFESARVKRLPTAYAKGAPAPKVPNAPTIARGAKKAAKPRTKGVKEGIIALISSEPISVADIIAKTGFKEVSIRSTLMSLKKAGMAMNDDKLWVAACHDSGAGNSESDHASQGY